MTLRVGYQVVAIWLIAVGIAAPSAADDLFDNSGFAAIASDRKASAVGDTLTIVVFQTAEARNSARNSSSRRSQVDAGVQADTRLDHARLEFGGQFGGQGEVRRSESFTTRISVTVQEVLPNGDLRVEGGQSMMVNGEDTLIEVRGRVRPVDITADNQVLSSRLAEAEISYDGEGFVSRSARPGLFHSILNRLGLN